MVRLFGGAERKRHELLSAYVDGEVTAEEAREVEDLLASSEDARRELAELQATVDLIRGLPELEPPRSFALDAAPKKRWTLWWPSVRTTGLATSVAAMLLVGLVAGDMLDVLEQARFGGDDSALAAAAPESAPESAAAPEPEGALTKSAAGQDESAQVQAAPAAAAPRMAAGASSEEPATAMQQDATEEAPQADEAVASSEERQFAMQSVMSADAPEANEEPVGAMQQALAEDSEITEQGAVVDYYELDAQESEGITLPLMELQVVTAIVVVVLVGATVVAVLRRRRSIL